MFSFPSFWRACTGLVISFFLFSCGGGGGGSSTNNSSTFNPVTPSFGASWTIKTTAQLANGSTQIAVNTYVVDGVNADGSYALAVLDQNGNVIQSEMALYGFKLQDEGCIYTYSSPLSDRVPLRVGETWSDNYSSRCTDQPEVTFSGSSTVVDEESIETAIGTQDTLKISRHVQAANGNSIDSTCFKSTTLGIEVQCTENKTFATTPGPNAVLSSTWVIAAYQAFTGAKPAVPSTTYPAFQANVPQVIRQNPSSLVLSNPKIVPIFFQDTQNQGTILDFLSRFVSSTYWNVASEYGVNSATLEPAVTLTTAAPSAMNNSQLGAWIDANAGLLPTIDNQMILIFYFPSTTTLSTSSATACTNYLGDHGYATTNTYGLVSVAVIPDCHRGLDTITHASAHELFETATDPHLDSYHQTSDQIWTLAYGESELGDLCAQQRSDFWFVPAAFNYEIVKLWSNTAASLMHDPCISIDSTRNIGAYFQSVPSTPDVVQYTEQINTNTVTYSLPGVRIPTVGSHTVDIKLFSDQAFPGAWRVSATQIKLPSGTMSPLSFSWDKTTGQNGDTLHLTITSSAPIPNGALIEIISHYGGTRRNWPVAIAN